MVFMLLQKPESEVGNSYGFVKVLQYLGRFKYDYKYLCICHCGKYVEKWFRHLRGSNNHSCGCMNGKFAKTRHYMKGTRFYRIWSGMKTRCLNKKQREKSSYRTISDLTLHPSWIKFNAFYEDMYQSYNQHVKKYGEAKTSIDRIDNSKGYSPENCRWATNEIQGRNKRTNHLITAFGETSTMTEWAEKFGITHRTLSMRLARGWTIDKALTEPVDRRCWDARLRNKDTEE